jgi:hypothetical protein
MMIRGMKQNGVGERYFCGIDVMFLDPELGNGVGFRGLEAFFGICAF